MPTMGLVSDLQLVRLWSLAATLIMYRLLCPKIRITRALRTLWKTSCQQVEEFKDTNTAKDREIAELESRIAEIETIHLLPVLMVQQ